MAAAAIAALHFLAKQTLTISIEGNLIMEKGTQTLLEDYVSIYERPIIRNALNIQMRKKQNELESLPEMILSKLVKKRENEND